MQHSSMKNSVVLIALCCASGAVAQDAEAPVIPERQMNVRQGPETVFDRPPADMLPALAGARATGENGRVGSELVFWGYEQGDGRRVFLFACAPRPDLDCATRVPAICPVTTTVLETLEASGTQVRRNCRNIAIAGPGDTRPGCDDRDEATNLDVGLVSCG
jgi:hypothetical protein